jgi:hypothetical protein
MTEGQPPPAGEIRMITPLAELAEDDDAEDGDPVCWAHLVCDECGAITAEGHRAGCSRARLRLGGGVWRLGGDGRRRRHR